MSIFANVLLVERFDMRTRKKHWIWQTVTIEYQLAQ